MVMERMNPYQKARQLIQDVIYPDGCLLEVRSLCTDCNGDGWTAEHDPSDTSQEHMEEGQCTTCPVQIGCDECGAKGYVNEPETGIAEVLRAIGEGWAVKSDGRFLKEGYAIGEFYGSDEIMYNLKTPLLKDQSEEVWAFIIKILEV